MRSFLKDPVKGQPQKIVSIFTAQWEASINKEPVDKQRQKEILLSEELNEQYQSIQDELKLIQKRMYELSKDRSRQRTSNGKHEQFRELSKNRSDLAKRLLEVRAKAREQGVYLSRSRSNTRSSFPTPPHRKAIIAPMKVSAEPHTASADYTVSSNGPTPPYAIIPGSAFARISDKTLQITPYGEITRMHEIKLGNPTAYFKIEYSNRTSLNIHIPVPQELTLKPQIKIGFGPKGKLNKDIDQAIASSSFHHSSSSNAYRCSAKMSELSNTGETEFEAIIAYRESSEANWIIFNEFDFRLSINEKKMIIPEWGSTNSITLAANQNNNLFKESIACPPVHHKQIPEQIKKTSLAKCGQILVVQYGKKLRLLNTKTFEWGKTIEWSNDHVAFTADAQHLYTVTDQLVSSYQLPSLKLIQEVPLPSGGPVLALSAGSHATNSPLVIVTSGRITLLDAEKLTPLKQPINDEQNASKAGLSSISWPTSSKGTPPYDIANVISSPDGEGHTICTVQSSAKHSSPKSCLLIDLGERWLIKHHTTGTVGGNRKIYYHTEISQFDNKEKKRLKLEKRPDLLIPTSAPGMLAINLPSQRTVPASSIHFRYLANPDQSEATVYTGASSAAPLMIKAKSERTTHLQPPRLIFLPEESNLLSIGDKSITLENVPQVNLSAKLSLPTLLNTPHSPRRGKSWSFTPIIHGIEAKDIQWVKGPELAEYDSVNGISWNVPAEFIEDKANFKLSVKGQELNIEVRVLGNPVSILTQSSDHKKAHGIPISGTLNFPDGIDRILTSPHQNKAVIVSNKHRRISLFDFSTRSITASYSSSTGPLEPAFTPNALLLWHTNGNILEKRNLKDLSPIQIASSSTTLPLRGLAGGSAPVAFLETTSNQLVLFEIETDSLKLSSPISLGQFSTSTLNYRSRNNVNQLASTMDNSRILIGNTLVQKNGPMNYTKYAFSQYTNSESTAYFNLSGDSIFSTGKSVNVTTKRSWSVNSNNNSTLIPEISGEYIMSFESSRNEPAVLTIIANKSRQQMGQLTGFPEFKIRDSQLFSQPHGTSRISYHAPTDTLLTLSEDNNQIHIRNLPSELLHSN